MAANSLHNHLFSSLILDIKSYSGKDPLLPWLRGIKKMKESLPPNVLKEKLPRFLQKCTHTFLCDRRYKNDLRYLRVWLQLMDYVDEPRALLNTMEINVIGTKRSLFYQAYALYHEKVKNFEEAEKMYHLGVQNLAEPVDELQKSYEQFLHRMKRHKNKEIQRLERAGRRPLSARKSEKNNENVYNTEDMPKQILDGGSRNVKPLNESNHAGASANSWKVGVGSDSLMKKEDVPMTSGPRDMSKQQMTIERKSDDPKEFYGDDTVVVNFVDTAIVGKSEAEDACHHGLVDPTINMKEAMNAINSMFREPLETASVSRRSQLSQPKEEHHLNNGFCVFIDENLDNGTESSHAKEEKGIPPMQCCKAQSFQPLQEPFQIFIDEEGGENTDPSNDGSNLEQTEAQNLVEGSRSSASCINAFVFPCPKDLPSESSDEIDAENSPRGKLREDTVVHRFVGSTILEEPLVENVCHHGLVDPTINLKEAMDDINNMFGKPIDFVRTKRPEKQDEASVRKQNLGGFSILPDDDLEHQQDQPPPKSSGRNDNDLFEPTVFTKEAMDDINKMFGMPLDF